MEKKPPAKPAAKSGLFHGCYQLLIIVASFFQSPVLLAVRLYWGWQFFVTGKGHLMNLDKTADFFKQLHIPLPKLNACLAGGTECVGGVLLIVGLGSRLAAVPLIFTMVIAYMTAESEALRSVFKDPDKFVSATPFLFLLACVIVLVFGPGVFSLDWLISKTQRRKP
jgi:putative oxidoreductase